MIKVSDFVFQYLKDMGVDELFLMSGGANMHLTDSVGRIEGLKYICPLHEQGTAMAVEAYARIKGFAAALVTGGPSVTNTTTGVAGAYIDSIPCLFIAGQVNVKECVGDRRLRQLGLQEVNSVELLGSITKYCVMIEDPITIKYHLQKALYLATHGRPGPVWIDIPLNVQGAPIDETALVAFDPQEFEQELELEEKRVTLERDVAAVVNKLKNAQRPVIMAGNGVRLANAYEQFQDLIQNLNIPVTLTWGAADLLHEEHPLYMGRPGIIGQRAPNIMIQDSDVLLCLGTRVSIPHTGYNAKAFAREATVIKVDIDENELNNGWDIRVDMAIQSDLRDFIIELQRQLADQDQLPDWTDCLANGKALMTRFPMVLEEYYEQKEPINSYVFIDALSDEMAERDVIVTDMGTSFTCSFQTLKVKPGQRFFTSGGLASMGFGLPGAIGACFANEQKRTICISGDGGLQMNIQELQLLVTHKLPLKLFVINNGGYLAIKLHQTTNFNGNYVGAEESSGVVLPDIVKIAEAYGIEALRISHLDDLHSGIRQALASPGPTVCEIMMPEMQKLIPRLTSKVNKDGTMEQVPLEDMFPFLEREELKEIMNIPLYGE